MRHDDEAGADVALLLSKLHQSQAVTGVEEMMDQSQLQMKRGQTLDTQEYTILSSIDENVTRAASINLGC